MFKSQPGFECNYWRGRRESKTVKSEIDEVMGSKRSDWANPDLGALVAVLVGDALLVSMDEELVPRVSRTAL